MQFRTKELTYIAIFVALAVVCAILTKFMSSMLVPFSFLPFIAVLSGAVLGKRLGTIAMAIYVLMGLIGIPVFAGDPPFGGLVYVFKPTFGFLLGFIAAAYVTGRLLEKKRTSQQYLFASVSGIIAINLVGLPYFWVILQFYLGKPMDLVTILKLAFLPFILLDIGKAIVAALIAQRLNNRVSI